MVARAHPVARATSRLFVFVKRRSFCCSRCPRCRADAALRRDAGSLAVEDAAAPSPDAPTKCVACALAGLSDLGSETPSLPPLRAVNMDRTPRTGAQKFEFQASR